MYIVLPCCDASLSTTTWALDTYEKRNCENVY